MGVDLLDRCRRGRRHPMEGRPDQEKAKERAKETVPFIKAYVDDCKNQPPDSALRRAGISLNDVQDVYFLLDSPIIKNREDHL